MKSEAGYAAIDITRQVEKNEFGKDVRRMRHQSSLNIHTYAARALKSA